MKFIILNLILVLSFFNSAHAEMNPLFEKIDFILIKKEKPKTPLDIFEAKKSKAPLDIIKEEEELRYLQDSFMAKEYGTGSHGGDPDSIEFALIGRQLHSDITNYGQSIFKGDFDFLQFKEKLDTAEINGYLFNNDSHGQGLRKQKFELHNSFEFKCAINKYQVNIIELDRKCFSQIDSYLIKKALVLHEYLGLMKKEWDLSSISSKLTLLENEIATQNFLEERIEIVSDYESIFNSEADLANIKTLKTWACQEYSFKNPKYRSEHDVYTFDEDFKLFNRLNDRYSAQRYNYNSNLGLFQAKFKLHNDTYLDDFRVTPKGEILSIVSHVDEGQKINIVARKCTTFKNELKNRLNLIFHRVRDYYSFKFDKDKLSKSFNRILKSRNAKKCLARKVDLESDFYNYEEQKYMREKGDPSLFESKYCYRTLMGLRDISKDLQPDEDRLIKRLDRTVKKTLAWIELLESDSDKVIANSISNKIINEIVTAQNQLFETMQLTEEESGTCSSRLKIDFLIECTIMFQYQDYTSTHPLLRMKQLERFERKFESIFESI
ncbi:MAG: hypothetical protein HON90_00035 [Halobacteriovoraceae bacterium]|nr:hypothetical protein [Halobacteriovoraceae bacterium]